MMGEVNNVCETLEKRFGEQVKVASYNIFYDETHEIRSLVDQIIWNGIALPAIFIDDELRLEGHIDEPTISHILKNRGLEEI